VAAVLLERDQLLTRARVAAGRGARTEPGFCDRIQFHMALDAPLDDPIGSQPPLTGYVTAAAHWSAIPASARTSTPTAGDLVFLGNGGAGHIALLNDAGVTAISSDLPSTARLGLVSVASIRAAWGMTLLGYAHQWWHGATLPVPPAPPPQVPTILPLAGWERHVSVGDQWYYARTVNGVRQVILAPLPPTIAPGGHWLWHGDYAGNGRWVWGESIGGK